MRRRYYRFFGLFLLVCSICFFFGGKASSAAAEMTSTVAADSSELQNSMESVDGAGDATAGILYENPDTGHQLYLSDEANLLTESERLMLVEQMKPITEYGEVAFATGYGYNTSAAQFALEIYDQQFGTKSGTIFLIDMENRMIYIYSEGDMYRTITTGYANIITDNAYKYASDGDYFQCAATVFDQELTLLQGRRIAQPMKYICNAFLALILAVLVNYLIVRVFSNAHRPSDEELLSGIFYVQKDEGARMEFVNETKTYSPQSSGGGSHGGGHGGGGGHSGGGGGHGF